MYFYVNKVSTYYLLGNEFKHSTKIKLLASDDECTIVSW